VSAKGKATAIARANIALAKYWGKSDEVLNLPAVPSISVTLEPMRTETSVTLDSGLASDVFLLGGEPARDEETARVTALLDRVRAASGIAERARVESRNHFPTASGLASSASGFAALAAAARAAYGLARDDAAASALARQASASAARSLYEGFVELPAGVPGDASLAARPLHPASHWDLRVVVAVITEARKDVGSTGGMGLSKKTSPYYDAWVAAAPRIADTIRAALAARDLATLGPATEHSFATMHALALSTSPPTFYFQPASMAALATVRRLRSEGVPVFATMDAGPHVKAVCHADDAPRVERALADTAGVLRILSARPGAGIEIDA
jgi:diphosphomevalonate decarboxylase